MINPMIGCGISQRIIVLPFPPPHKENVMRDRQLKKGLHPEQQGGPASPHFASDAAKEEL